MWDLIRCNAQALSAVSDILLVVVGTVIGGVGSMLYAGRTLSQSQHDAYERIYSDYQFLIQHLIQYRGIRKEYKNRPQEFWFYEQMYALLARVWRMWSKKMIDDEEWKLWKRWLEKDLVKHRVFKEVHRQNSEYFPPKFIELVEGYMTAV